MSYAAQIEFLSKLNLKCKFIKQQYSHYKTVQNVYSGCDRDQRMVDYIVFIITP